MTTRTLVIGGGLAGVATLYELTRRGHEALLLEGADTLTACASFANGGLLTASIADPWNGPGVGRQLAASLFDPGAAMKLRLSCLDDAGPGTSPACDWLKQYAAQAAP